MACTVCYLPRTCRVESLLDGNLYLILWPAVLNILDPSRPRAADINGPRKSFSSPRLALRRRADKETRRRISSSRRDGKFYQQLITERSRDSPPRGSIRPIFSAKYHLCLCLSRFLLFLSFRVTGTG